MQTRAEGRRGDSLNNWIAAWMTPKTRGRRLTWVVAGVFPLLVFAAVMLFVFTSQQEHALERMLGEAADGAAHLVDRIIGEQLGLMNGMAASNAFDRGDLNSVRLEAQRLWAMHPEWRTVIVTDENRPLLNLRYPADQPITPLRDPESLQRVLTTKQPFVGNLVHDFVGFRVPVVRDDRIVYTIAVPISPKLFLDELRRNSQGRLWAAMIIGHNKEVIAATTDSLMQEENLFSRTIAQNASGFLAGDTFYLAWSPIGTSGWQVLIEAPAAAVVKPFFHTRVTVYLGGILAACLTVVFVLALNSTLATKREATRLRTEVSERIRAEEALREREEELRAMFDMASIGIGQADAQSGKFSRVNPKMCLITGYSADELLKLHIRDITYPEDQQQDWEAFQRVVRGEASAYRIEKRYVRKDGSLAWVNVNMTVLRDPDGQPTRTVATIEDISERKQAEQALQHHFNFLQQLINAIPAPIFFSDKEGIYTGCNKAYEEFKGLRREQIIGRSLFDVSPPELARIYQEQDRELFDQGGPKVFETQSLAAGGMLRDVVCHNATLADADGTVTGMVGVMLDITERKKMEALLWESQEKYRRIVETANEGVWSMDEEYRTTFVNRHMAEMLGIPPRGNDLGGG